MPKASFVWSHSTGAGLYHWVLGLLNSLWGIQDHTGVTLELYWGTLSLEYDPGAYEKSCPRFPLKGSFKRDIAPCRAYSGLYWHKPLEPREGEPRPPNKAYLRLLGGYRSSLRPYWEDLAQLVKASQDTYADNCTCVHLYTCIHIDITYVYIYIH